jgi:hypothetical protein
MRTSSWSSASSTRLRSLLTMVPSERKRSDKAA